GERDLFDLSAVGLVRRQELLLRELLGDRASTGDDVARAKVVQDGPDDALDVKAGVGVEALVLDRDGGQDHRMGDVFQLHGQPVVAVVPDVCQQAAGAVGYQGVPGEGRAVEALDRGQAVEERLR